MKNKLCSKCNTSLMSTMMICHQCGSKEFLNNEDEFMESLPEIEKNKFSVSRNLSDTTLMTDDLEFAGFFHRFTAAVIDTVILIVFSMVCGVFLAIIFPAVGIAVEGEQGQALLQLSGIVLSIVYFSLMESSPQSSTFGKRLIGLKVTNLEGGRIGLLSGVGRYFARWISTLVLMIGYLIQPFTKRKQALHDLICSTVVIQDKGGKKNGLELFAILTVGLLVLALLSILLESVK